MTSNTERKGITLKITLLLKIIHLGFPLFDHYLLSSFVPM